jgi:hypothetical protein
MRAFPDADPDTVLAVERLAALHATLTGADDDVEHVPWDDLVAGAVSGPDPAGEPVGDEGPFEVPPWTPADDAGDAPVHDVDLLVPDHGDAHGGPFDPPGHHDADTGHDLTTDPGDTGGPALDGVPEPGGEPATDDDDDPFDAYAHGDTDPGEGAHSPLAATDGPGPFEHPGDGDHHDPAVPAGHDDAGGAGLDDPDGTAVPDVDLAELDVGASEVFGWEPVVDGDGAVVDDEEDFDF